MKKLPRRLAAAVVVAALVVPAALVGVEAIPTPRTRPDAPPRITAACQGRGPLAAGAAEVPFDLPPGTPIAGFARLSYDSAGVREPVGARALVLRSGECRIAVVSAELLLVPDALEDAVRARLPDVPLDGLVLAATHTHAGPGGYMDDLVFERLALGPFDPAVRDRIAGAIAEAIRRATRDAGPARLSLARARVDKLVRNRDGGPKDARLTVLRLESPDGAPISEVALFPAHPTTLGKRNRLISGDWAGRFLGVRSHGVRLLLQGAVGDQSVVLPTEGAVTPELYAAALSTEVDKLRFGPPTPDAPLGWARAEVTLPAPIPGVAPAFLERPARNFAFDRMPAQASVAALRLGPVLLTAVPGEPVAEVGAALRDVAGPGAEVVSLANGYVGYVETAPVMAAGRGETRHTYYGPDLAARLSRGVAVAAREARERPAGNGAAPGAARAGAR